MDRGASSVFANLAKDWRARGKNIRSFRDLLLCYYSDFKIVCIPAAKSHPLSLLQQQYQKLQNEIKSASLCTHGRRESAGLLMSAEEMGYYLKYAFDHFCDKATAPFNFLSAALFYNPVATTFKDHICTLAVYFMASFPNDCGKELFRKMAPLVASSIFLSAHRSRYPGRRTCASVT